MIIVNCIYAIHVEGSYLIQCVTDGDDYGNVYDPDLDNNLIVQTADRAIFKPLFFTTDPHADFNSNGIVQAADLAMMKRMLFQPPEPSCITPGVILKH